MPRRKRSESRGARELAFETLLRVEKDAAFASVLLDRCERRVSDPREAALLHELVLGVLRRKRTLDSAVDALARKPGRIEPEVRTALRIGAYSLLFLERVPNFAAVDRSVELVKRSGKRSAAGLVNAILRGIARDPEAARPTPPVIHDVEGLARFHDHPSWWVVRLVARMGWEAASRLLEADNLPARTALRVNSRLVSVEQAMADLEALGLEVAPSPLLPGAIRLIRGRIGGKKLPAEGRVWVQDEAAQMVGCLLGGNLGPKVLDLCAAPGGKTLQIRESLRPGAWVLATDRHPGRLGRLSRTLGVAGRKQVKIVAADMEHCPAPFLGTFDQVLLDAPCSGTGTLRRHPEIRWRLELRDLKLLADRQRRLLEHAAALTSPGGRLVYSVCSMEPEEGEDLVNSFVEKDDRFSVGDPRPHLPATCHAWIGNDGLLRTSPGQEGLDGFFGALLNRRRT